MHDVEDGLKLYLEPSWGSVTQNMFYNRCTHDHYVGNVFIIDSNGLITESAINAPG